MYVSLAIIVVAMISMLFIFSSTAQMYGQANMTGGNVTAPSNMTAGGNATVKGGVSGIDGGGDDGSDGGSGSTNLAVSDPGAPGKKSTK